MALALCEAKDKTLQLYLNTPAFKKVLAATAGVAKHYAVDEQVVASGVVKMAGEKVHEATLLLPILKRVDSPKEVPDAAGLQTALLKTAACMEGLNECSMRLPSTDASSHYQLRCKATGVFL